LKTQVECVGRAPLRKVSRKERFIGPASELAEQGKGVTALLDAAEMAFRFHSIPDDEENKELAKIMKEKAQKNSYSRCAG
jgi:mannitol-1-phosphate 5-dehydrogenase